MASNGTTMSHKMERKAVEVAVDRIIKNLNKVELFIRFIY